MKRTYTNPSAAGYLTEAAACKILQKEFTRLVVKFERTVKKEENAREADFEQVMQFGSEREIQDLYGFDCITAKQYERYLDIFRRGREALDDAPSTTNACALRILRRIEHELLAEQSEWEFAALTPAEQDAEMQRCKEINHAWKKRMNKLKREMGRAVNDDSLIGEDEDNDEETSFT